MPVVCFQMPLLPVACERARLNLWGEPFVLATPDGTVRAASEETLPYGITVGQSLVSARSLCQSLIVLPYDRDTYLSAAQAVWDALAVESSVVEPVSETLSFVEITGREVSPRVRRLAEALASHAHTSVQVGIATTKLVAHQAARRALPGEVKIVEPGQEAAFLAPVDVAELECLEKKVCQRLLRLGVRTLGEALRLPAAELARQFKQTGWHLRRLAHGEDGQPVRAMWPPRSLQRCFRFEYEVCQAAPVEQALQDCTTWIADRLRRKHEFCRSLELSVRMADESYALQSEQLAAPLDAGKEIHRAALRLLKRMHIKQPVVEVVLVAGELGAGSGVQLALLEESERGLPHERQQKLDAALTFIRRRYGGGAVVPASLLREARRIHLWTYSLTRRSMEAVEVAVDEHGTPVRFARRGQGYQVREIQNRWREAEWAWGEVSVKTAYRVVTEPPGLFEIYRSNRQWRIGAVSD